MKTKRKLTIGLALLATVAVTIPAISTADRRDRGIKVATKLKGKHTEPGPGDPDGSGRIAVHLRVKKKRACFDLDVHLLNQVIAARIFKGAADEIGRKKLTLLKRRNGLTGTGSYDGCALRKRLRRPLLRRIAATPEAYYVSIETQGYPQGALRGQLKPRGKRGGGDHGGRDDGGRRHHRGRHR